MKQTYSRRYRPRTSVTCEGKKGCHENFFGDPEQDRFFQPSIHSTQASTIHPIHRKCAACEAEEKVQRMPSEAGEKKEDGMPGGAVHRMAATTACAPMSMGGVSRYVAALPGKGTPLPAQTRQFFEARMGHDFSRVRVHTGEEAAQSASALQAKAYTTGSEIVFGKGEYDTSSGEGKRLLAHELVHVVQQDRAGDGRVDRKFKEGPKDPNINLAKMFVEAKSKGEDAAYFGETRPTLNTADMTKSDHGMPLHVPAEGDLDATPVTNDGGVTYHSKVTKRPSNETSYLMSLPTNKGKWKFEIDVSTAEKLGLLGKGACSNSNATIVMSGDPDESTVYEHTKTHEEQHAKDISKTDTEVVEKFADDIMQLNGQGATAAASRKSLLTVIGIMAKQAVQAFVDSFTDKAKTFHGQAAGAKGEMSFDKTKNNCMYIQVKGKT